MRSVIRLALATWKRFDLHGDLLAAAISFYTLIAAAPLMVLAITVSGLLFDRASARASVLAQVRQLTSADVAAVLARLMDAAENDRGHLAAAVATLVLFWAASRFFLLIQDALNLIWGVRVKDADSAREAIKRVALKRVVSFAMVLGSGLVLLCLFIFQTLLATLGSWLGSKPNLSWLAQPFAVGAQLGLSLLLLTGIFAVMYRVLPDVRIHWADVWVGALLTGVLMLVGTGLLGLYLLRIAPAWLQGAIGSFAAFMLWTYYMAQVFLLGASFTRAWSCRSGAQVEPETYAQLTAAKS